MNCLKKLLRARKELLHPGLSILLAYEGVQVSQNSLCLGEFSEFRTIIN